MSRFNSAENAGYTDADATNNSLQYAIKTWAQDADDLLIYMVDHGGEGTLNLPGGLKSYY